MIFYQDMENILKDLQQLQGKPAVSLFIKTHRTFPDNEKDPIALKNQLKIAEEHLKQQHGADIAKQAIEANNSLQCVGQSSAGLQQQAKSAERSRLYFTCQL